MICVVRRGEGEAKEIHGDRMKETISRKKHVHTDMYSMEENLNRYKGMNNIAKNAVSKALRENAEEAFTEMKNCPHGMFTLVK